METQTLKEVSINTRTALSHLVCSVGLQLVHGNEVPCKGFMTIVRGKMQCIPSLFVLHNWKQSIVI